MIALRSVSFRYGERAVLEQLTATVRAGELVVLAGANGAGKSTLLRLVAGLLSPLAGRIEFEDRALGAWDPLALARRRAYVPQQAPIRFPFTVEEVVLMGRAPHAGRFVLASPHDRALVRRALEQLELEPLAARPVDTLSGGEQQRVALARALAQQPRLFVLDEPEAHLDLRHRVQCYRMLRGRCREGAAALVASHDLALAASFADRLLLLHRGRLLADGTPEAVLRPELLARAFGIELEIVPHPRTGRPHVLYAREPEPPRAG